MKKGNNMKPTIYFDLDGTLYDLYGQEDWLPRLRASDPTAYAVEDTLHDAAVLLDTMLALVAAGYTIGIVTWLSMGATPEYDKAVRAVKREWIKRFVPMATEVHIVKYGTPKHQIVNDKADAILVDDNTEVLSKWTLGQTIHADENLIAALQALVTAE
jgi:5'(3')-deoxyribonucleotidase